MNGGCRGPARSPAWLAGLLRNEATRIWVSRRCLPKRSLIPGLRRQTLSNFLRRLRSESADAPRYSTPRKRRDNAAEADQTTHRTHTTKPYTPEDNQTTINYIPAIPAPHLPEDTLLHAVAGRPTLDRLNTPSTTRHCRRTERETGGRGTYEPAWGRGEAGGGAGERWGPTGRVGGGREAGTKGRESSAGV